jgi:hypothetical protein
MKENGELNRPGVYRKGTDDREECQQASGSSAPHNLLISTSTRRSREQKSDPAEWMRGHQPVENLPHRNTCRDTACRVPTSLLYPQRKCEIATPQAWASNQSPVISISLSRALPMPNRNHRAHCLTYTCAPLLMRFRTRPFFLSTFFGRAKKVDINGRSPPQKWRTLKMNTTYRKSVSRVARVSQIPTENVGIRKMTKT